MPEKTTEKVEMDARRYVREAEDIVQNTVRAGNDFMTTNMKYYFDMLGMMMRYNMQLTRQTQRAMDEMVTIYREAYKDGIKSWEGYINDINKIVVRPSK
jgi:hypothetical protein